MKISVICVYNDRIAFREQLGVSLDCQNIEFEMIAIDNTERVFSSAASALNYGVSQSTGEILIFSHQDIRLKNNNALQEFAEQIDKCEVGTIIGTQGVREKSRIYYSNLTAGDTYIAQECHEYSEQLYEVSCVDEGFFGMRRETWTAHPFDEILCDNWHLYCVESCLNARKNHHKVYVYPLQLHHFSYGTITLSYMKGLKRLCYEYGGDFKYIWTTCYKVRTDRLYINLLIAVWIINRKVRRRKLY